MGIAGKPLRFPRDYCTAETLPLTRRVVSERVAVTVAPPYCRATPHRSLSAPQTLSVARLDGACQTAVDNRLAPQPYVSQPLRPILVPSSAVAGVPRFGVAFSFVDSMRVVGSSCSSQSLWRVSST